MPRPRKWVWQGRKLKAARGKTSTQQMAGELGVTDQAYKNWEAGLNRPDPAKWEKLGRLTKLDISTLYAGKPDPASQHLVNPAAIWPLLAEIRTHLELLEAITGPPAQIVTPRYTGPERRNRDALEQLRGHIERQDS